ncbi:hypothetical protein GW7_12240 [Heterocephalus glaber]|uniref:Secreted protein n=1 Tax=Heterocephalus glaber TaxID=10181 RepID=G5ASP6_HETGA|nr:hypothetical protein GW7_12240 [Heterocephalus glaber]
MEVWASLCLVRVGAIYVCLKLGSAADQCHCFIGDEGSKFTVQDVSGIEKHLVPYPQMQRQLCQCRGDHGYLTTGSLEATSQLSNESVVEH